MKRGERSEFDYLKLKAERLWRSLREFRAGVGQAYLISGDPESGKTRLLLELAAEARLAGVRVIAYSARDVNSGERVLAEKIMRELDDRPYRFTQEINAGDLVESAGERNGRYLRHLAEWVGNFCTIVKQASLFNPSLIIIDDVDQADRASTKAIAAVARNVRSMRLMIVLSSSSPGDLSQSVSLSATEFASVASAVRLPRRIQLNRDACSGPADKPWFEGPQGSAIDSIGVPAITSKASAKSSSTHLHLDEQLKGIALPEPILLPQIKATRGPLDTPPIDENCPLQEHPSVSRSADSRDSAAEQCDRLIAAGEIQARKGEYQTAENSLREAATIAERLQDPARFTRIVLALPAWHWPGPSEANPLATLLARRGLVLERENSCRRAILTARLAAELSYAPDHQQYAADLGQAAMEQIRSISDPATELYVRLYRDPVLRLPGQLPERLTNIEQVLRLAIETGDYGACCVAAFEKSRLLTMIGDIVAAEHTSEFAVGIVQTSQIRLHDGLSAAYRMYRAVMDGDFTEAAEEFGHCRALAQASSLPYLVDACWPMMLLPYSEEERLSELEDIAEDTARRRRSVGVYAALLSWLKIQKGCSSDASFLLERLAADNFASLSKSAEGLVGLGALAYVCADLNRLDCAAILYGRLLPYAKLNSTLNAVVAFGSLSRYVGVLASLLGQLDEAIVHFEHSYQSDRRSGARPWAIYSGLELTIGLARRGTQEDQARAVNLLSSLETEATMLKMHRALAKLRVAREMLTTSRPTFAQNLETTPSNLEPSNQDADDAATKCIPEPQPRARAAKISHGSSELDPMSRERIAVFCRNGEYWQIGYEGCTSSLSHRRGLELISILLRNPGGEFFALELAQEGEMDKLAAGTKQGGIDSASSPVLDAEAKRCYRERLIEIREELEKLREANNLEHAAKLEQEQDFLTRELARAIGLFGRDRKLGSHAERARKRVSAAISRAIRLISLHDEQFGRYLEVVIKTGNVCSYTPNLQAPVTWRL